MKRKSVLILSLIFIVIILGGLKWLLLEYPIMACTSLDHRYSFTVLRRNIDRFPVMPGQGSDIGCFVELREIHNNRLIFRGKLNMLQEIEEVRWETDSVWINRLKAISYNGLRIGDWNAG